MIAKTMHIQVSIHELGQNTRAQAQIIDEGRETLLGEGTARCNPIDENVPDIGDELSVARALADLSHQLIQSAVRDIEDHTHHRVEQLL